MEQTTPRIRYEIHPLQILNFIFMLFVIGGYSWLRTNLPIIAEWLPTFLTVLGASFLLITALFYNRYSQVYDHEPTVFLGRPSTGKEARLVLSNVGFAGLSFILVAMGLMYFECILSQGCDSPFAEKFDLVN
jgi:hypothetical protein